MGMGGSVMMPNKKGKDGGGQKELTEEQKKEMEEQMMKQQEAQGKAYQEEQKLETMKMFGGYQRKRCVGLGNNDWDPPKKEENSDGSPDLQYFKTRALDKLVRGKGEALATLCIALDQKDRAGELFAQGEYEAAEHQYRLGLWLLVDDDSDFDVFNGSRKNFEECPGAPVCRARGRFNPPEATADAGEVVDVFGDETSLSEAELEVMKQAEKAAAEKYRFELPCVEQAAKLRQTFRLNVAACAIKRESWTVAKYACESVLARPCEGALREKAQFRLAQALEGDGSYSDALKSVTAFLKTQPNHREARDMHARLKKRKEAVDNSYKKMFKAASNNDKASSLYTENEQRSERAKAAKDAQVRNCFQDPNFQLPQSLDPQTMMCGTQEQKAQMMSNFFKEAVEKRKTRYEDMGLNLEAGEFLENMHKEGYTSGEIQERMQYIQQEQMEEMRMSMTDYELEQMEEMAVKVQTAHGKWSNAPDGDEKKDALDEANRAGAEYQALLKAMRKTVKARQDEEMEKLKRQLGLQTKEKERVQREAEEQAEQKDTLAQALAEQGSDKEALSNMMKKLNAPEPTPEAKKKSSRPKCCPCGA